MSTPKPTPPEAPDDQAGAAASRMNAGHQRGRARARPQGADRMPDGEHRYVPRSPYTTGND